MNAKATNWMLDQLDRMSDEELVAHVAGYKKHYDSYTSGLNGLMPDANLTELADNAMRACALAYNYTRWRRPSMSSVVLGIIS